MCVCLSVCVSVCVCVTILDKIAKSGIFQPFLIGSERFFAWTLSGLSPTFLFLVSGGCEVGGGGWVAGVNVNKTAISP